MLLLSPLQGSTKLATHISLVTSGGGVAIATNVYIYFRSRELLLRTECPACGQRFVSRHEVISAPSDSNTFCPLYHLPLTSALGCICGDTTSRLWLSEISLGEPITEVQVNRPYY